MHGRADLEGRTFLCLVVAVSIAFAWILWPFYGAILWAAVVAIVFTPLYRRLFTSLGQRRTLAALATVIVIVVMVILPLTLIAASLVREATAVYARTRTGEIGLGRYLQQVLDALPPWALMLLHRFGLTDLAAVQERLSAAALASSRSVATQALDIGQNAFDFIVNSFVMLYLLFFLLLDGEELTRRIKNAVPLPADRQRALVDKFTAVIRATVKGSVSVALVQGALGGLIFWFLGIHAALLWAVVMAVLSLLPVVGTALVWLPVAIYFLVTGARWQGLVLIAYGVLVIGLVDNLLRPILVGKDAKMPDYVVLVSTLGGIEVFGFNGFVIGPVIAAMFMAAWDIFAASRSARR
jgi:predicted PurR-regulated permease PerM